MKLIVTMDVEPNDYCSPAEARAAVEHMLNDPRWRKLDFAEIYDGEREVGITLNPDTVTVEMGLPEDPYAEARRELAIALTDDSYDEGDHGAAARLFIARELSEAANNIEEAADETALGLRKRAIE